MSQTLQSVLCITINKYLVRVLVSCCMCVLALSVQSTEILGLIGKYGSTSYIGMTPPKKWQPIEKV